MTKDCFGLRNDPDHPYCQVCDAFLRCKIATAERERHKRGELSDLIEATPAPAQPIQFRPGSRSWAACDALVRMTGEFTEATALPLYLGICRVHGIRPGSAERNIRKVTSMLVERGILRRVGRGRLVQRGR